MAECWKCYGSGLCEYCGGTGKFSDIEGKGADVDCFCCTSGECPECDGTGEGEDDEN
jgi:hypothetical protein